MSRVVVVGAGTMGNGIAHVFAQHGWDAALIDVSREALEQALKTIRANADRQVKKGTLSPGTRDALLARIRTGTALDGATGDAELVVEAATEDREVKFRLFRDLDRAAPPWR